MNKKEYYENINTRDIGSVPQLRKVVNEKLIKRGYRKLKGYKLRKQLYKILQKV